MGKLFNAEAYEAMQVAERAYLEANGWSRDWEDRDSWSNDEHDRYGLTQGHATNVQKQYDRIFHAARQQRVGEKADALRHVRRRPAESRLLAGREPAPALLPRVPQPRSAH